LSRIFLTIVTALSLLGAYRVYSMVLSPMLKPVEVSEGPPAVTAAEPIQLSATGEVAKQHLPNSPWAQDANFGWYQGEDVCAFTNKVERLPDGGNKVRLTPFALIWRDKRRPEGSPYTMEAADGAVVHFENQFFDEALDLGDRKAGRIVHIGVEGKVRITGPDNLNIEGEKFIFSEESAQLYSDWPITFRYGPAPGQPNAVRGQADQITIEFARVTASPHGPELPRIGDPVRLRLRKSVRFDMNYEISGKPARTVVTSDGPFVYDFEKLIAQFEENVVVVRPMTTPQGAQHTDTLKAPVLALQFTTDAAPGGASLLGKNGQGRTAAKTGGDIQLASGSQASTDSSLISKLRFKFLRALGGMTGVADGPRVQLESTENSFAAEVQDLQYNADSREVTLIDQQEVRVQHESTQLYSPKIRLIHGTSGSEFEKLECEGAGHFEQLDNAQEQVAFFGSWSDKVQVVPDPESDGNILSIFGGASLVQPDQMQLDSQTITVWLDSTARVRPTAGANRAMQVRSLPLKRALAEGDVQMTTADVIVRTNVVDAAFEEGKVAGRPGGLNRTRRNDERPRQMPGAESTEPPFVVWADRIDATVRRDPQTGDVDVPELIGRQRIRISRAATPPDQKGGNIKLPGALEITGHRLQMKNAGGTNQVITLAGATDAKGAFTDGARMRIGDYQIESGVLVFDRGQNRVDVPGPGQLHLPMAADMRGNKLQKPQPLDVAWVEKMSFDGQFAHFYQKVKARLGDSQLTCEEMGVGLNRKIDFQSDAPERQGLELQSLDCRHNVTIEMYEYADSRVVDILKATLASIQVDNATGDFEGLGPGQVRDWRISKGGSSRLLSVEPTNRAQTNQPTRGENRHPWDFIQLNFKSKITGNLKRQDATLTRDVQILYAPVAQALQMFRRNDLSIDSGMENGSNGAWLGCRELDVVLSRDAAGVTTGRLLARGGGGEDANLEGRKFTASGNEIAYDQSKGQFILRGRGNDKADIHFQDFPGAVSRDLHAKVIQFVPAIRELILDGASFNGLSQ
jgi:hypothetical protein